MKDEQQGAAGRSTSRPITVADTIEMTRLGDPDYYSGASSRDRVARFSPDGSKFVVVIRKGNLRNNTNEYSVLLWQTALLSSGPQVVLTFSSSSNRAAIEDVTWLEDGQSFAFLGSQAQGKHQVFTFNVKSHRLNRITQHPTDVLTYSITPKGDKIAYFAAEPVRSIFDEKSDREGLLITDQGPAELLAWKVGGGGDKRGEVHQQLFFQSSRRSPPREVAKRYWGVFPPALSPDGKYVVTTSLADNIPESWKEYSDPWVQQRVNLKLSPGQYVLLERFELFEVDSGKSRILLDSPARVRDGNIAWSPDSKSVALDGLNLPLDGTTAEERQTRRSTAFAVEVNIRTGTFVKITEENLSGSNLVLLAWDTHSNLLVFDGTGLGNFDSKTTRVFFQKRLGFWGRVENPRFQTRKPEIQLEEGMNTPPRIVAIDEPNQRRTVLRDLNPQFNSLRFGRVEEIQWKGSDGLERRAGLYYPVHYVPGQRYPLVIQTHRWTPQLFWIDGPWSTAFAAQPLAGREIMVLQLDELDEGRGTPQELENELRSFEGAIEYLNKLGFIDTERIGLIGFSRTCLHVKYALTHSKYRFAAASVSDGVDGGYLQYLLSANSSLPGLAAYYEGIYGALPFGSGLKVWMAHSPGFNLDGVRTPLRITALNPTSALAEWEWFAALRGLGKAVEMVTLRDGEHTLEKPWERRISLEGNVDWFVFWLKGEEDPNPTKSQQYQRWRALRARVPDSVQPSAVRASPPGS